MIKLKSSKVKTKQAKKVGDGKLVYYKAAPNGLGDIRLKISDSEIKNLNDGNYKKTSQGFPIVKAAAARTGLQTYIMPMTGRPEVRYRPFDEVTNKESLESWNHASATIWHPDDDVTLENARELRLGYVTGTPVIEKGADGEYWLIVEIVITDKDLFARILSGELVEVSAGYSCFLFGKPGIYNGVQYHSMQTQIRINHIAFLPDGYARAGRLARVRSSDGLEYFEFAYFNDIKKERPKEKDKMELEEILKLVAAMKSTDSKPMTASLDVDGITIQMPDAATAKIVKDAIDKRQTEINTLKTTNMSDSDKQSFEKKVSDKDDEIKTLKDSIEEEKTKAKQDAVGLVNAFIKFGDSAKQHLKLIKEDGTFDSSVSARHVYLAALKSFRPSMDYTAKSDDALLSLLEDLVVSGAGSNDGFAPSVGGTPQALGLYDAINRGQSHIDSAIQMDASEFDEFSASRDSYRDQIFGPTQRNLYGEPAKA